MKRFFSYLSAALAVLLLAVSSVPASAASGNDKSAGLSIQPRKNYVINPGQTIKDKLTIGNLDNASGLSLSLKVIDFTFSGQTGTPKLYIADNAPQTPWSLKPFTTLPKTVDIGPGESKTINYSITVPKTQGAGSYYSAIMYKSGSGNGGNVALGASGVTLVFVSVPGTVNEKLTVQKLGAYASDNNGVTGGFVYIATSAPQMIAYALKNAGNVAEAPAGSITLKNMFGKTVNSINKTNENQSLALIGQTRLFATCINTKKNEITKLGGSTASNSGTSCVTPHLMPGLYTAKLDVFYGQNGNQTHELTATAHFWYLPWWFIILVLVVLAILGYAVWWTQRKVRGLVKGSTYRSGRGISRKKS